MSQHQMKIGMSAFSVIAAALIFVPSAFAISALDEWNNETRIALATPVKIWLGLMMLTNIAALGFLKNHVASRFVFAGFVLSHAVGAVMVMQGMGLLAGQVSLLHVIFWTPGMIFLILHRAEIKLPSAYGVWAILSLTFYFGSMIFDVPDAIAFIQHALGD
ncbi:MAG: hypothetical protein ABJH52_02920 [Henriciella sp.]